MAGAMRLGLHSTVQRMWAHRGCGAYLLWPVSRFYRALIGLRRQLYRWGMLKTHRVNAIVVMVGNVVAGGAGKTPTVIALVKHLQAQGHHVGVISRGYGRIGTTCVQVQPSSAVQEVGDEPALIQRATGAPVFVARSRYEAATELLAAHPLTQIIICDDGLQHYGLYRDIEICVFDNRGCGNNWLLPAGLLREPWPLTPLACAGQKESRLLVLHTGTRPAFGGFTAQRSLTSYALRHDGSQLHLSELMPSHSNTKPLVAIAGIAQPDVFFSMLRDIGLPLARTIALPDHYKFDHLPPLAGDGVQLLCTEKDALKLWQHHPTALAIPLLQTAHPSFFKALDALIAQSLTAKLSSAHGHKTS